MKFTPNSADNIVSGFDVAHVRNSAYEVIIDGVKKFIKFDDSGKVVFISEDAAKLLAKVRVADGLLAVVKSDAESIVKLRAILNNGTGGIGNLLDKTRLAELGIETSWIDDFVMKHQAELSKITKATDISNFRTNKLLPNFNKLLGENIPKDKSVWQKTMKAIFNESGSKGSVGEAFAIANKIGIDAGSGAALKFSFDQNISDLLDLAKKRTPDNYWIYAEEGKLIISEVKVGSSFDANQLTDYGKIMDALTHLDTKKGKAIEKYLTSKGIPSAALDNVELRYIVLDGGNGDVSKYAKKIEDAVENLDILDNVKFKINVHTEW